MQMIDDRQARAHPYDALEEREREEVHYAVMQHVRAALMRGPHGVLELRAGLGAREAGALPVVLTDMVQAGEIAALGHCVYARVPWMPATRPVTPAPLEDLVLAGLTRHDTPRQLAEWLGVSFAAVEATINALEQAGLVEECRAKTRRGCYRLVSSRMAGHIRRGAVERIFADVARHG